MAVSVPASLPTVTGLLLARAASPEPGLAFEGRRWSWQEHVSECARYAAALRARRTPGRPFHVGVLADNVPEFSFLLGGCAFAGAVLVALNPVRRGEALARDVTRTDCQYVLAGAEHAALLPAMDVPVLPLAGLELPAHAPLEVAPATPDDLLMLIFTSGTSGEPKAVRCTHGKIAVPGRMLAGRFGLGTGDTVYVSMPMFHSNAIMAGWAVGLAAGAAIALRRRFSASGFLPDIRAFGATYANYVGKPLSYVLATPERADDADNPLRIAYGNEGAQADLARFAERFGCTVIDGFGSTEGGVAISRTPGTPPGALGKLADGVAILHPDTGRPCPPASFGSGGELLNPAEAVGELVNTSGPGLFAGYYDDAEADASRVRGGMYWSGDLGYADADGFCWFAGRAGQWLRVDGENLGTAPIERALLRHPVIAEAAVYGVPDPIAGDQVMACIVVRGGTSLTPAELGAFLAAQGDIGGKQRPRFVRVADAMPRTATFKMLARVLAADRWNTSDPVWWCPDRRTPVYVPLHPEQAAALEAGIRGSPTVHPTERIVLPGGEQAALQARLRDVYWIGGGSGAGKSTIARRLAARHGLRLYATDAAMADHGRRSSPVDSPFMAAFAAMNMDERWVSRSPQTMLETFGWFRGEGFGLIVEDLLRLPAGPGVIAEGFRLLPRLVRPLLAGPGHAVWLCPTQGFRRAAFTSRGSLLQIAGKTSDPDKALAKLLERDRMFTDRLREEATGLGLPVIDVDITMTEDDLTGRVARAFGLD